ncbi:unnamed protein product, partial [marine sediment metagenome]
SDKNYVQVKILKAENRETKGELNSPYFPGITLHGEIEETEEGLSFYITRIRMFTNWPQGWTDAYYEASGHIVFQEQNDQWTAETTDTFELWGISKGEIRYYDAYFRGDEGLWKVKNRIDRIRRLNRFFKDDRRTPVFYPDKKGFVREIVPFLFPEAKKTFNIIERKRLFSETNLLYDQSEGEMVEGASLFWNTEYSQNILPEQLIPLRDSGTLWRDFEEASGLIYSLYNLEYIVNDWMEGKIFSTTRSRK